jgi:hypothetical protein
MAEWLDEAKESEKLTDTPNILSVTITAMWETWEEAWNNRNNNFKS